MSQFRELISELLGAEIQLKTVHVGARSQALHFRQFSDAEGERIFRVVEGESVSARGTRVMRTVVAASICDVNGQLIATEDELAALPPGAVPALYLAAAEVNNLPTGNADPDADEHSGADEDESPNA